MIPAELQEELRQIRVRQVRIKRLEVKGYSDGPRRCPCCGKLTMRFFPNLDGDMVGETCRGHHLKDCLRREDGA